MKLFKKENSEGLRWIIKNCKREIPFVVLLSVFFIILALVNTAVALLSKYAIDAAQHAAGAEGALRDKYIRDIIMWGVVILIVIAARLVLRVVSSAMGIKVQAKLTMKFRSRLFYGILNKKYEKINKIHSGELINRLTSDISIISDGVITIIPNMLYYITQFLGAFIVLVVIAPKFTVVFLIAGIFISIITLLLRGKFKGLHKEVQSTEGVVRSFFQEAIESMLVVKTFGAEDTFLKKGDEYQEINYRAKMKRRRVSILANAGFSFVFNAGYLAALVWAAIKVAMGALTYGTLTAMLQLITQIQAPFVNITKVVRTVQYYDTRGILVPSELTEGGRRLYSEEDVKRMKIICFLRDLGLSIDSISQLLSEKDPGSVIALLLDEQEKTLKKEVDERKERLKKIVDLKTGLKSIDNISVESIGDIAYIMTNKMELQRVHRTMLLTGIPLSVL